MQGLFVNGERPKSKKAVKEAIKANPESVSVEATSIFGEFGGALTDMPIDGSVTFVGPDPYKSRRFYGTVKRTDKGFKVS